MEHMLAMLHISLAVYDSLSRAEQEALLKRYFQLLELQKEG